MHLKGPFCRLSLEFGSMSAETDDALAAISTETADPSASISKFTKEDLERAAGTGKLEVGPRVGPEH
jgi:hypothetical protein